MKHIRDAMRRLAWTAAAIAVAWPAAAQFVYPAKGQSPEQQKKDEAACHSWAVDQSGFDPAKPPPAPPPAAPPPVTGSGARARGAAAGAAVGAMTDRDTGDAAKAGAVGAAAAQRGANRRAAAQQQQAAGAQQQAGQASFEKARAACLEGRGYTVK
ncbi:MAG TPA: hypothetical protein VEG27_07065 [Usitatibacter sp.]|nr:hypothetical protein [Usitatibacter sp.]